jgi:hypothetical protein
MGVARTCVSVLLITTQNLAVKVIAIGDATRPPIIDLRRLKLRLPTCDLITKKGGIGLRLAGIGLMSGLLLAVGFACKVQSAWTAPPWGQPPKL